MEKIVIMNSTLPEPSSVGATKTTFDFPVGTITEVNPPSEIASDYTITLNGVDYVCNYFNDGETKITASYKTSGHDTISIAYRKTDGSTSVVIKHDEIVFQVGDPIKLVCAIDSEKIKKASAVLRFSKDVACKVVYDESVGFTVEEI